MKKFDATLRVFEEAGLAVQDILSDKKKEINKVKRKTRADLSKIAGKMVAKGCAMSVAYTASMLLQSDQEDAPFKGKDSLGEPCSFSVTSADAKPAIVTAIEEMAEKHTERLTKKSLSLKDKMKSNAGIISVTIEDDIDFKQKLTDSEDAFPCTLTEKPHEVVQQALRGGGEGIDMELGQQRVAASRGADNHLRS